MTEEQHARYIARTRANAARRAEQLKHDHKCTGCGVQLPEGYAHQRCESCLQYARDYAKMRRNAYKKGGLCVWCGKPAAKSKTMCEKHIRQAREAEKKWRKE